MFKRRRPDLEPLKKWLDSDAVEKREGQHWPARGLFKAWREYAQAQGAEPGSPRAFSNELRKAGFPTRRATEVEPETNRPRRRFHAGLRLINPYDIGDEFGWYSYRHWEACYHRCDID